MGITTSESFCDIKRCNAGKTLDIVSGSKEYCNGSPHKAQTLLYSFVVFRLYKHRAFVLSNLWDPRDSSEYFLDPNNKSYKGEHSDLKTSCYT